MKTEPPWVSDIRQGWWFLLRQQAILNEAVGGGLFRERRPMTAGFEGACYGLLLVQAYAVLEDALRHLRDDGQFRCGRDGLERLMSASHSHLPWTNFDFVDEGRRYRNRVVHDLEIASRLHVLNFVRAVQEELRAWASYAEDSQ